MIRYALVCIEGHGFEGWFRSSADFDSQEARGLLACTHCGSPHVRKALMAPRVVTREDARPVVAMAEPPATEGAGAEPPARGLDNRPPELVAALRELKSRITEHAEDVGKRFPEEARRIHYGEAPARGIFGAASADDVRGLRDEGIEVLPLPVLPDERN
ncbi:DUF1178 family protein [Methylobrevis pamukkalensis]|uniref:DUF1178 family protein n=1 Tax=Methylobrevis pamukkalensis TaxID=1439726 RepID=A0A1E3GYH7_9HYPH|nr:DUF1178 family protein [Methylobrevis pamukkalensis]ODN69103.1 hypothetical protein A6302_03608 [Methylobrevis pamukkalensis]